MQQDGGQQQQMYGQQQQGGGLPQQQIEVVAVPNQMKVTWICLWEGSSSHRNLIGIFYPDRN